MSLAVQKFYDDFLASRMIGYRLYGNLRLELAKQFLLPLINPKDVAAELGCGIGIVSEAIARANPLSQVVALDLSPSNIEYAKATIKERNLRFFQADITRQFDVLEQCSPSGYDIFALIDVIEHMPETERTDLFSQLAQISKPSAKLALTYPSPEFQRHLIEKNPSKLQIIDNVIEFDQIVSETAASGWELKHYSKVDVWMTNQYIHCLFCREVALKPTPDVEMPSGARLVARLRSKAVLPYRVWRYKMRPMRALRK